MNPSNDPNATRVSLLHRVRDRTDQTAWSDFVGLYYPMVYRWASEKLQATNAEDIASEVLEKLFNGIEKYRRTPNKTFRGWLKAVTRNAVLDQLKRASRRFDGRGGDDAAAALDWIAAREELNEDFERQLAELLTFQEAMRLLESESRISKRDLEIVHQRSMGKSFTEIAESVGESAGTVRVAYHRTVAKVRVYIRDELPKGVN
jgi:RNA polymerase sigma-70 factor (ECF subfamily)